MREWWQHIPEHIDPIAFTVGFFSVHWYALCWLIGFLLALFVAFWYQKEFCKNLSRDDIFDLFLYLFAGAFIGGHLGYAFLYQPNIFLNDPIGFFSPYHPSEGWIGISGMSFHGGFLGVVGVLVLFALKRRLSFLSIADFVSFVTPVALFLGRIGNFLAGELYGRMTNASFGMYFPQASGAYTLRHPSTLYEALGEGVLLWGVLLFMMRHRKFPGEVASWFLIGYGTVRFLIEFVREPDSGRGLIGDIFTRGQLFSSILILGGVMLYVWLWRKNRGKIGE